MDVSYWQLGFAVISGMALGLVYFGGLWLTVRRLPCVARPALLMACSYLGRLGVTITGFCVLGAGSWQRLLALLCGFMVTRTVLVRICKPDGKELPLPGQ